MKQIPEAVFTAVKNALMQQRDSASNTVVDLVAILADKDAEIAHLKAVQKPEVEKPQE